MRRYYIAGWMALLPLAVAGCATTGNQDMINTVYNTNRVVRSLEQNLTPTVTKLNQTTTDLGARVDSSEQELARLAQTLETNTAMLAQIQQQVDDMQRIVYRQAGMTPPRPGSSAPVPSGSGVQLGPVVQETPEDTLLGPTTAPPAPLGPTAVTEVVPPPSSPVTSVPGAAEAIPPPPPVPPTTSTVVEPPATTAPTTEAAAAPAGPGQDLYMRAGENFRNNRYEEALADYDAYLRQHPNTENTPNAQFWKGETLLRLNRQQDAIREFEKLRQEYPTNSKVPYGMYEQAKAMLQLGQNDEAVALLKQLVNDWPMTRPAATARRELEQRGIR